MSHFHLDLHVNKHAIGTIIISSLTVIAIAALEYTQLNWALAYEKQAVIANFEANNSEAISNKHSKKKLENRIYSEEADLNSADELSENAKKHAMNIKKSMKLINSKFEWNDAVKKLFLLNEVERKLIVSKIDKKIEKLQAQWIDSEELYEKRLWSLVWIKEILLEQ